MAHTVVLQLPGGEIIETTDYTYEQVKSMVESRLEEPWVEMNNVRTGDPTAKTLVNLNTVQSVQRGAD